MEIHFSFPILAGFTVGFLIGLTGMGGGALMTPFLILAMKINPVIAVGTDLTFAALTKIFGGIAHRREHNASFRAVAWMSLGSMPASYLGARLVLQSSQSSSAAAGFLPKILGVVLTIVGVIVLARNTNLLVFKDDMAERWPRPWIFTLIGASGGFLVGLTSVGGGTVIMALLIVFFSIPINHMVGLDVAHGALLTIVPAITYAWGGQTNWPLVGLLLIGSIPGVWIGAHSVNRINHRYVRGVLSILILGGGIQLLFGGH
ncbi:MAG: sulfite exporter TauE/SafE family protein [Anaerolineales bacterium]|nr:sulfite exporter TauE/SafE family protein [Anaerolineales bacterium]